MSSAPATGPRPADVLLEMVGVRRSFGDERAVDGLDLTVRAGEIHAIVGLNGAGKSTLMRLALGMLRPDAGQVILRPVGAARGSSDAERAARERPAPGGAVPGDTTGSSPWRARASLWSAVGHLVEAPFAYPELSVRETIVAAARLRGLSREEAGPAARRMLSDLSLDHWADKGTKTLSMGNRQRLGLACAAVHEPRLLVLDEPTTALDPAGVLIVRTWLQRTRDAGAGVLVSSHHLDEVARMADRITVIHRGKAIGALAPDGVDLERQFFDMVYASERSTEPAEGLRA